jgi:hypothetical protein
MKKTISVVFGTFNEEEVTGAQHRYFQPAGGP